LKSNHQAQSGRYSAKVVDMASQFKAKFVKKNKHDVKNQQFMHTLTASDIYRRKQEQVSADADRSARRAASRPIAHRAVHEAGRRM